MNITNRKQRIEALRQAIGKTLMSMTRKQRMQVSFLSVMAAENNRELEQSDLRLADFKQLRVENENLRKKLWEGVEISAPFVLHKENQ